MIIFIYLYLFVNRIHLFSIIMGNIHTKNHRIYVSLIHVLLLTYIHTHKQTPEDTNNY